TADNISALTPIEKFNVWARGATTDRLGVSRRSPASLAAPLVVERLLGSEARPSMLELLKLDWDLRRFSAEPKESDPDIEMAHRLAAALLERAMGDTRTEPPPGGWGKLADKWKAVDLWTWAALADILQAASG